MNPSTRLEQDLTDWLRETAVPHTPDYTDEILDQTARIRQRPRWTFIGRWVRVPEPVGALFGGTRPLAPVALLVLLVLILATVVAFVGGRQALPPPFGLTGAGLLVVSTDGDIVLVDPTTAAARPIVANATFDRDPRGSPDGSRLAFIRETTAGEVVIIVDATGREIAMSKPLGSINPDSLAWSPDGRQIAITKEGDDPTIVVIDASTGSFQNVPTDYLQYEVFWRPSGGRQLLFRTNDIPGRLAIVSLDDGSVVRVPTNTQDGGSVRPLGWTPDGQSILYQHDKGPDTDQTIVLDLETAAETRLDVLYGHVSNDGARVAGIDRVGQFCVIPIGGGSCRVLGADIPVDGSSVSWSPDDRWIAISRDPVWLVDPVGALAPRMVADHGTASWQRTLP